VEEKNVPVKSGGKMLALKVALLWYCLLLVPFALLSFLFFGRSTMENFWLWRFVFTFAGAAVAEVVVYFVVFPLLLGDTRKTYKNILMRIGREGYTPQVVSDMEQQLPKYMGDVTFSTYRNGYCKFLCEAYAMLGDYDTALRYHSMIDTNELFRSNNIVFVRDQALWHGQLIQINAMKGDIDASAQCLSRADGFLRSIHGRDKITDYFIDLSEFEYYLAVNDFETCKRLAEPYMQFSETKSSACRCLAKLYARSGDKDLARQYYDMAVECSENQFIKDYVLRDKAKELNE
jgi:tetratricopeptide (TPR) repeat protein